MKHLALCLALLLLSTCSASMAWRRAPELNHVALERWATLSLMVHCLDEENRNWLVGGSAVAISPRHLLTAEHVIDCDGGFPVSILAMDRGEDAYSMEVDKLAGGHLDVARLVARKGELPFPHWAEVGGSVELGDAVCVTHARPRKGRKCGEVVEWRHGERWAGAGCMEYEMRTIGGTSGSGVWKDGKVVGIHIGGSHGQDNDHYSVGVTWHAFRHLLW